MYIYLYSYSPTFPRSPQYSRVIYHFVGGIFYCLLISVSTQSCPPSGHNCFHFAIGFNLLNPTGHVMHQQFNIQQLYVLPALYVCVLYLSENKQRLVPLTI